MGIEPARGRSHIFPQPLSTVTIEKAPEAQRIKNLSHLDDKKLRDLTLSLKRHSIIITQSCLFVRLKPLDFPAHRCYTDDEALH